MTFIYHGVQEVTYAYSYTVIVGVLNARRDGVSFKAIKERYKMGVKGIYLILNLFEALGVGLEEFTAWPPEKVQEARRKSQKGMWTAGL